MSEFDPKVVLTELPTWLCWVVFIGIFLVALASLIDIIRFIMCNCRCCKCCRQRVIVDNLSRKSDIV